MGITTNDQRISAEEILQREHGNLLQQYDNARLQKTRDKLKAQIEYSEYLWDRWMEEGC